MTKITLGSPITMGEKNVSEISLREPTAGELRGVKLLDLMQFEYSGFEALLPRITTPALSPGQVAALKPKDYLKLCAGVVAFFGDAADFPTV